MQPTCNSKKKKISEKNDSWNFQSCWDTAIGGGFNFEAYFERQIYTRFLPRFNQRKILLLVMKQHYSKPVRKKIRNKMWLPKHDRRYVVTKWTIHTQNVFPCVFFSCNSKAVQIPVPKSKSVSSRYYQDVLFKKPQKTLS